MATLIPSLGSCFSRMSPGQRRLAERLEQKLGDDYRLWYGLPLGPGQAQPDFLVMHPRRGLLTLEVRDWPIDAIVRAGQDRWDILAGDGPASVANPLAQARHCAEQVVEALRRDPALRVQTPGPRQGQLAFPWSYGVVFPNLTRQQFLDKALQQVIEPHHAVCSDEMGEATLPKELQSRLWDMFPMMMGGVMTPAQLEQVRWILFPELRLGLNGALAQADAAPAELPEAMPVMDLRQEQLARSLDQGHQVIHGVAGAGKTAILTCRAELLARASAPQDKPVLVVCYSEPLATKLAAHMAARGLSGRVQVHYFHRWCRQQLVTFGQKLDLSRLPLKASTEELAQCVIQGVASEHIPAGQYQAVLIDEGHDFAPEWLTLMAQMADPATSRLLVLCDGAQRGRSQPFSFESAGIRAQGRTALLKTNRRNTRQILQTASLIASGLLAAPEAVNGSERCGSKALSLLAAHEAASQGEDAMPVLAPESSGREGEAVQILRLPTLQDEAAKIAELLAAAHQQGIAWGEMAIICRHARMLDECAQALGRSQLPFQVHHGAGTFYPEEDSIKLLTMAACKGLEFALVALAGVGQMPTEGEDEPGEARLLYVAATRATDRLIITLSQPGAFGQRLLPEL